MAQMYYEKDADLQVLAGKTIAIIGYGSQGHAHSQNLRDSGQSVIVADLPGSRNWNTAIEHGFDVMGAAEAATKADILMILVNDEYQADMYKKDILPNLKKGAALAFAHGFNIHFSQILPDEHTDVFMVAPKGPGHLVRRQYEEGAGVPCLFAIYQDATGLCRQIAMAYGKGLGGARAGMLETTFKEETETDLFGEQAVLCGGTVALVKAGFETLVNAGYQPEIAYFECMHELKLIVDLLHESGIAGMRYSVSDTAQWGDMVVGPRIITEDTRAEMKLILSQIQSGEFAKNWILENKANRPMFRALTKADDDSQLEKVGAELRGMMPWLRKPVNAK